jgi:hypothetical protein
MAKKESEACEVRCPVYEVLQHLCGKGKCATPFFDHLKNAKVELLMAVRSLIDTRIDELRKKSKEREGAQRIKITEKE